MRSRRGALIERGGNGAAAASASDADGARYAGLRLYLVLAGETVGAKGGVTVMLPWRFTRTLALPSPSIAKRFSGERVRERVFV
jgi:hypothetical protein